MAIFSYNIKILTSAMFSNQTTIQEKEKKNRCQTIISGDEF